MKFGQNLILEIEQPLEQRGRQFGLLRRIVLVPFADLQHHTARQLGVLPAEGDTQHGGTVKVYGRILGPFL